MCQVWEDGVSVLYDDHRDGLSSHGMSEGGNMILMTHMGGCGGYHPPCKDCKGTGKIAEKNNERCKRCAGSGKEPPAPMNEG